MKNNIRVALLLGGTSPEREVSIDTAHSVYEALKKLNYRTILIDPAYGKNQPQQDSEFFSKKPLKNISNKNYIDTFNSALFDDIDIVFIALHGRWGEDGTVQSLLELRNIRYTGSGIVSSALSMDKIMSKIIFEKYGVPTPPWFSVIKSKSVPAEISKRISDSFGFPCVVKPNDQGSTVGLTVCNLPEQLEDALQTAFGFSELVVVEKYIAGRELTVGILNDHAFPPLEIRPKSGLYDYESKYTSGKSEYEVPAKIPDNITSLLQRLSLVAFNSLRCRTYARVDFRLSENNEPFCLEVNTLPGMTSTSLVPKMAKAEGISFEELIDRIIKLSLKDA
ncbi:MAG: D-alanine--D-alanine ligase [Ignavibacteriaceae bacterium]